MDSTPTDKWSETFLARQFGPDELEELASSQLEHALDARRRGLKIYESLKSLNEVIGTQYGDRVLFELVQNAHDAHNPNEFGEISIRLNLKDDLSGTLYVANRGRSFTFSNFDAIRNIGTSDKEIGEGIGNKGLGFRSVEALTDDPRVYSQGENQPNEKFDGYCFRFALQDEILDRLSQSGAPRSVAAQVAQNISRYLVPLPLEEQPEEVRAYAAAGFATVIELPLRSREAVELARAQVTALANPDAPLLLFLDRVAKLNIEVADSSGHVHHEKLTRQARQFDIPEAAVPITLHEVKLDSGDPLVVVRRVLPKLEVLAAVQESIPFASTLKRWLEWKGDAVVSIAVGSRAQSIKAARLFNFLPMDGVSPAPIHGYVDAPFFADIDRRSINADLPLNSFLLESAAEACAAAALMISKNDLNVPASSVVDLVTWSKPHVEKIVKGFASLNQEFTSAD